jgi:hypothetical protein
MGDATLKGFEEPVAFFLWPASPAEDQVDRLAEVVL